MRHQLAVRRATLLTLVALFSVIPGALAQGSPAASQAQQPPAPTEIQLFLPWGFQGLNAGVAVAERVDGTCWVGSLNDSRPDAWRCESESRIYDPCFQGFQSGQVILACTLSPWSPTVVLLTATAEMPPEQTDRQDFTAGLPWALELADGSRCARQGGTQLVFAGLRTNYGCDGGSVTGVLGAPDRSQPQWRVFALSSETPAMARQVEVVVAWW